MSQMNRRRFLGTSLALSGGLALSFESCLFAAPAPGVEKVVPGSISGEERTSQPDIWALEVTFKTIRMIEVTQPDAKTGQPVKQLVWYMPYRVVNRLEVDPIPDAPDTVTERPLFVPELLLITEDNGQQKKYYDRIMPVAQAAINKRERHTYKNSVEIVGPLPAPVGPKDRRAESLDGVAMWRGVDPKTDYFKVFLSGFSNGYVLGKTPDGEEAIQRKTLVINFWRPSDSLKQNEEEIRLDGEPQWVYR